MKKYFFILITIFCLCLSTALFAGCDNSNNENTQNNDLYTITFDSQGGSQVEPITKSQGKVLIFDEPTYEGYTFDGWYFDKEGTKKCNLTIMPTEDITLYAHWLGSKGLEYKNGIVYCGSFDNKTLSIQPYFKGVKTIIIPDHEFDPYNGSLNDNKFNNKICKINIPDSIEKIGEYAFRDSNIKSIILPKNINEIYGNSFSNCKFINEIKLKNNKKYYVNNNCLIEKQTNKLLFGCNTSIISDEITTIEDEAFSNRETLKSINIPSSVKYIGFCAFSGCNSLTEVKIPEGVEEIGDFAFCCCTKLKNIYLPDSLKKIDLNSFPEHKISLHIKSIKNICESDFGKRNAEYIKSGVQQYPELYIENTLLSTINIQNIKQINRETFYFCKYINTLIIDKNLTKICIGAFNGCSDLNEILYKGTKEDWEKIIIEENNVPIFTATKYYYSEEEPTDTTEKYWHYGTDGVTPVIW